MQVAVGYVRLAWTQPVVHRTIERKSDDIVVIRWIVWRQVCMSGKVVLLQLAFKPSVQSSGQTRKDLVLRIPWIGARQLRTVYVFVVDIDEDVRRAGKWLDHGLSGHCAVDQ